jgi:hypothetical protein
MYTCIYVRVYVAIHIMENLYRHAPLQVTFYDVSSATARKSFFFLGSVPKKVLTAARRATVVTSEKLQWAPSDCSVLREEYGPKWRSLLTPTLNFTRDSALERAQLLTFGGNSNEELTSEETSEESNILAHLVRDGGADESALSGKFGELSDFDNINETQVSELPLTIKKNIEKTDSWNDNYTSTFDTSVSYLSTAAYPEDTLEDLQAKIYYATGVPPYRQHVFYRPRCAGDTPYRITLSGRPVRADILQFAHTLSGHRSNESKNFEPSLSSLNQHIASPRVAGVPVDLRLEARRQEIYVESKESNICLLEGGQSLQQVFVADLMSLVAPRQETIAQALQDRYQADLLYYGVILKFWPSLSFEAFSIAITAPSEIASMFPILEPSIAEIKLQVEGEQVLLDSVYSAKSSALHDKLSTDKEVSVTEAVLVVKGSSRINIRNVFDGIATSYLAPLSVANLTYGDGRTASAVASAVAPHGRRDITVEKRHVSAAVPRLAESIDRLAVRMLKGRGKGVAFAILQKECSALAKYSRSDVCAPPCFVLLTIFPDGSYELKGNWREDERVGLKCAESRLCAAAASTITAINRMGAVAFPIGGKLVEINRSSNVAKLSVITASFYWPYPVTISAFRQFKLHWKDYERAGIASVRGLQQSAVYNFLFRKGMSAKRLSAQSEGSVGMDINSQLSTYDLVRSSYARFTDSAANQKWQQYPDGRSVRVFHRTSDLRVEVSDASPLEFARVRRYMLSAFEYSKSLHTIQMKNSREITGWRSSSDSSGNQSRLRSLQEQDPELFEMRKHDNNAPNYSVLCQGERQPEIVSSFSSKGASKNTVPYWNFTEKRPTLYRCPSKTFPFLSFRTGEHPLGYCLPCCKKMPATSGSRSEKINNMCLSQVEKLVSGKINQSETTSDILVEDINSRHVLAYGKAIPARRISKAPYELVSGLLAGAVSDGLELVLIGVTQQLLARPDVGFFFALAYALGSTPADFVRDLAETARLAGSSVLTIAEGRASVFLTSDSLANELLKTFTINEIGCDAILSPFGPGGSADSSWEDIIADLAQLSSGVEVVTFEDILGDGELTLRVRAGAAARLSTADSVAVLVTTPTGTYPMTELKLNRLVRAPLLPATPSKPITFSNGSSVLAVIRDLTSYGRGETKDVETKDVETKDGKPLNSDSAISLTATLINDAKAQGWGARALINMRNLCYGVIISPTSTTYAYLPVPYEPVPRHVPLTYGSRPLGKYPAETLMRVLSLLRPTPHHISTKILWTTCLRDLDNYVVGFVGGIGAGRGLYHHHDPVNTSNIPWADSPVAVVPYPFTAVDAAILDCAGTPDAPLSDAADLLAAAGLYRHFMYRLFVAEFSALLRNERDLDVRARLSRLIRDTDFYRPAAIVSFRSKLSKINLSSADLTTITDFISYYIVSSEPDISAVVIKAIGVSAFDFDRTSLKKLRETGKANRKLMCKDLAELMSSRVLLTSDALVPTLSGVYVACALPTDVSRPQCSSDGRLRMPADKFKPYVSVLAADICNPSLSKDFGSALAMSASGLIDDNFIARPGEHIVVR